MNDAAFKLYGASGEGEDCPGKSMNLILGRMFRWKYITGGWKKVSGSQDNFTQYMKLYKP